MQRATTVEPTPGACADALLDSVPPVMRAIRGQMRGHRAADLSVPQFRALGFLHRHPGVPLTDLADHIGLTPPAASRLVDGLVARGYVQRRPSATDRRAVELTVSPEGAAMLEASRARTRDHLAGLLAGLPPGDREAILRAADVLRRVFGDRRAPAAPSPTTE